MTSKNKSKVVKSATKPLKRAFETSDNDIDKEYNPKLVDSSKIDLSIYFRHEDIQKAASLGKTLQMTDIGLYSISKPADADLITELIIRHYQANKSNPKNVNKLTMIDGTAGMGGNVISFAKQFGRVIGVEYNPVHFAVLQNNVIDALQMRNVDLYHGSILDYAKLYTLTKNQLNNSIFFFDPPWGGRGYKKFKFVNLMIGGVFVSDFVEQLHQSGYPYIVLKAPLNFNIQEFFGRISYTNVHIHKHHNMMILFIF